MQSIINGNNKDIGYLTTWLEENALLLLVFKFFRMISLRVYQREMYY